jgi:hypothetical protein
MGIWTDSKQSSHLCSSNAPSNLHITSQYLANTPTAPLSPTDSQDRLLCLVRVSPQLADVTYLLAALRQRIDELATTEQGLPKVHHNRLAGIRAVLLHASPTQIQPTALG